ncbi:hypothetical protein LTR56_017480 [Elasticomyces elasticus]|nr:hypothetical protein LTR56_017480 [Elasticomyces elasticus]KAK3640889.1 hypothetical protein LTR22_016814 [Elasticomyces elasticus]KAK4920308.1 hypothetical protein LTR49_012087 [Elasticomyces elasticus]KAK5759079.1 hypothetical protein LTS12_010854 [Elasticomyces elasticus]
MASHLLRTTRPRAQAIQQCRRTFSSTPSPAISLQLEKNDPDAVADSLPPYPYGPTRWYKQSSLGLYGGQRIRFGNNVGEKFENKTRRSWQPNVLVRKLFSKALGRVVQVRVTTRVLRTIDKLGGLDEYLLGEKESRIRELGESGWWLRWAIMQTDAVKARFVAERQRLGVSEDVALREEAEVAEAQQVIEGATELDMDEAEAVEISEAVGGTDGAFIIEQPAGVPPLKFRVGPGKHLVLTAEGWRRTRPDPERLPNIAKAKILANLSDDLLPQWEKALVLQLAEQQAELKSLVKAAEKAGEATDGIESRMLSAEEQKQMLREARREWKRELKARAEAEYDRRIAAREERKGERKAVKREGRAAERERAAVALVEE